ncbi:hypothetical protein Tco_0318170 [Tanacetum coccineum]
MGPLSGKGPRVIVSADASILPRSVFVRGDATGAVLKILAITSLKCVLTQEHLDAICAKYFVPEEVHPQLPSSDATMHERPAGKVGMYTRFFDYANYCIPFSTFFMSVLTHFRISFSQLSVFGSAKVSHFEILCRICNIEPSVKLFRYFYTHNYKNGWFGFTKRPNVRACYSKNLDSVKNWNDHFFWVDEFVVPANARFSWFSGSNIVKDRAPAPSEYNVEHINALIAQASPFLRFPEEFLCWVGISRNYLLNKDTYPRFEYENGEEMDLSAFIRTTDPRKVMIVERARAKNERPIVTVAKHRTVNLLPTSVVRSSGELSASVEREFVGDASVGDGGDQGFDSVGGQDNVEPTVPVTEHVETEIPRPKRSKKKKVTRGSEKMTAASHPPKRLRVDYGTIDGSATGGKCPSVLNRLLQDSRLMVEQGVPALPTLPFITSSMTASPLEEGGDHTDSVTGPSLRTVGPSARFVVLSNSSHHSATSSAGPEGDSFVRSTVPVMTEATVVTTIATTAAIPADVGKDKSAPHPSAFGSSSSSKKTDRTLSLFTGRSGSGFAARSNRAEEVIGAGLEEIYVPEWTVTKGFELNDGHSCANMIDHFTPPAFFKTVHGMEHEQLFAEFNVSAARNLSLSSEVRMHAEYNILEKRKWRSLAEEKDCLLGAKDKEIEDLKSQLLKTKEESVEVARLRAGVSSLKATEGSLRGEVTSAKEYNGILEQECGSLKLKVHELETSSTDLCEKLEMYEGSLKRLEEFQDNLMRPLKTRLAEIDADFTRCCMRFQESFPSHLLNIVAGRRWLLTHGMQLLMAKCLNSTEYMEALGHAFGRAIEKGMQEGLAAGIEHGQAGRCLTDLEAYIPSAEADFNSNDIMDLLRLDDAVAKALGMTDLQPDVSQLMVPVYHKQDRVIIGSQALSVALDICRGRVEKMERNLIERLPFLKDVFVSIDDHLSAEALIEPPVEVPATNVLSTVVIVPHPGPSVSIEDYDNPNLVDMVPKNVTPGPEGEEKIDASTRGDLAFSKLDDEARDVVL